MQRPIEQDTKTNEKPLNKSKGQFHIFIHTVSLNESDEIPYIDI